MTFALDDFRGPGGSSNFGPLIAASECFILIAGAKWLAFAGADFAALPINPYLAVIVLAAAQHGLFGGLFAALLAIVADRIGQWPVPEIGDSYFAFLFAVWSKPLAWLLAGLAVGLISTRRLRAQRRSAEALARAVAAQELVERQYAVLADRTRRLERRLAGLDAEEPRIAPPTKRRGRKDTGSQASLEPSEPG